MEASKETPGCCLHRFNCCFIPFLAILLCITLFTIIIVVSKVESNAKDVYWKETSLIGDAFRLDCRTQKVVVPILRRCDGPEISVKFFTAEDNRITDVVETPSSCGSSLSNWLSGSPTELSLNYLSTSSDSIHAVVLGQDFVHIPIIHNPTNDSKVLFTVCVLPSKADVTFLDTSLPETAAFFEAWLYYGGSKFIVYDLARFDNDSDATVLAIYNSTNTEFPYKSNKKLMNEKFSDANLFYAYDCFYRSQQYSQWIVITTFNSIPMVQTNESSLSSVLSTVSGKDENGYQAFSLLDVKTEEITTTIFDPNTLSGFDTNLQLIFKNSSSKIIEVPSELVKTYGILQLNAALFQQSNTSSMNQVFHSWVQQFNLKANLSSQ